MIFDPDTFFLIVLLLGLLGLGISTFLIPFFFAIFGRASALPRVSAAPHDLDVLIPAHDEEENIIMTIRSIKVACAQAGITVRLIVGADACRDSTVRLARAEGAEVVELGFRSKWETLKALTALARTERIALVDAGSAWTPQLVNGVWDLWGDNVVGVSPTYRAPKMGLLRRIHWAFESLLKSLENRVGGPISVHGATVFYRRAELVETLSALPAREWKNDDVVIPMALRILYPKLRLVYASQGIVEDRCPRQAAGERGRRLRMVRGNLEILTDLLPEFTGPGYLRATAIYLRRAGRIFWAWWVLLVSIGAIGIAHLPILPLLLGFAVLLGLGSFGITGAASAFLASIASPLLVFPAVAGRVGWRDSEKWLSRPPRVQNPVSWVMYVVVITLGWASLAVVFRSNLYGVSNIVVLAWAGLTAFTTVLFLGLINFFGPFLVVPRRSEVLTLTLILPIPGMFWKFFFFNVYGLEVVRFREVLIAAPLVALFAISYRLFEHYRIFRKGPLTLAAALSAEEFNHLENYISVAGLRDRLKLVSWQDIVKRQLVPYSLVYSRSALRDLKADGAVLGAIFSGLPAMELRRLSMLLTGRADIDTLDTWFFLQVAGERSMWMKSYDLFRNSLEPLFAFVLLVVSLPLLVLVGLAVRLSSPGPALYAQVRSGYMGKRFRLLKFRTMMIDAEANGPEWAQTADPRITRIGAFMRKTRLDELPQLWNIVRGELSFVGPRPERPEIVEKLVEKIPVFPLRLVVKPGISGWAQVNYGYVASVEESRIKLEYDLYYILHRSLWVDILIVLRTVSIFWKGGTGR